MRHSTHADFLLNVLHVVSRIVGPLSPAVADRAEHVVPPTRSVDAVMHTVTIFEDTGNLSDVILREETVTLLAHLRAIVAARKAPESSDDDDSDDDLDEEAQRLAKEVKLRMKKKKDELKPEFADRIIALALRRVQRAPTPTEAQTNQLLKLVFGCAQADESAMARKIAPALVRLLVPPAGQALKELYLLKPCTSVLLDLAKEQQAWGAILVNEGLLQVYGNCFERCQGAASGEAPLRASDCATLQWDEELLLLLKVLVRSRSEAVKKEIEEHAPPLITTAMDVGNLIRKLARQVDKQQTLTGEIIGQQEQSEDAAPVSALASLDAPDGVVRRDNRNLLEMLHACEVLLFELTYDICKRFPRLRHFVVKQHYVPVAVNTLLSASDAFECKALSAILVMSCVFDEEILEPLFTNKGACTMVRAALRVLKNFLEVWTQDGTEEVISVAVCRNVLHVLYQVLQEIDCGTVLIKDDGKELAALLMATLNKCTPTTDIDVDDAGRGYADQADAADPSKARRRQSIPFLTGIAVNIWCLSEFKDFREQIAAGSAPLVRILCMRNRSREITLVAVGALYNCSCSASFRPMLLKPISLHAGYSSQGFSILKPMGLMICAPGETHEVRLLLLSAVRNLASGRRGADAKEQLRWLVPNLLQLMPDAEDIERRKNEADEMVGDDDGGVPSYELDLLLGHAVLSLLKELAPVDAGRIRLQHKNVITSRAQRPAGLMSDQTLRHLHKLKVMDDGGLALAKEVAPKVKTRHTLQNELLAIEDGAARDKKARENATRRSDEDMVAWIEREYQQMTVESASRRDANRDREDFVRRAAQGSKDAGGGGPSFSSELESAERREGHSDVRESTWWSVITSHSKTTDRMLSGEHTF